MNAPVAIAAPVAVRRKLPKAALALGAALVLGGAGAAWIRMPGTSESTDNAYLHADSTTVSARIGGTVVAVLVRDNQRVRAGDPLLRIDPQESDARFASADADVADADAAVASARAALVTFAAERRVAAADVAVARTSIATAVAERARADADNARYGALLRDGFASRRDSDRIAATAVAARGDLDRSRAALVATRSREEATGARLAMLEADLAKVEAAAVRARAVRRLAQQDRSYTVVRAAVSGIVGNRQVRVGDLVQPGSQLVTIVPRQGLYVIANFKETQTARMVAGQRATITVDALDGAAIGGHVESFSPSAGSEFALLPFQPGSGNFTKIVQRVPVRIALDDASPAALRSGLSVTARIHVAD